MEIPLATKPV
uniref:Uncharacterized protein n=1 Tax=Anguilla anguilla TaxID=7936 RepID=A0A0E9RNU3_ANGAN